MSKHIQQILLVASSTLLSRLLGLARDVMIFSYLGSGMLASAFLIAFTLPNLFRRLLGEGALTAALVPTFSDTLESDGSLGAFCFLNKVLTHLILVLLGLTLLMISLLSLMEWVPNLAERWYVGAKFAMILMPYMMLICCAAVFSAALNIYNHFIIPSLTAVWLNLSMIASLGLLAPWLAKSTEQGVYYLCLGVLVGGGLQALLPMTVLWRRGWRPHIDFSPTAKLNELFQLFLPGIVGAAVFQINVLVSRLLAFSIDDQAASVLYIANRLIELPMGIFTIAVATVIFPKMARSSSQEDIVTLRGLYSQGLRVSLAVAIPAAVGLWLLGQPILTVLFEWGAYSARDVIHTLPSLSILAFTLPFYTLATIVTRGLHACKDTRTPVRLGCYAFVFNLLLALALIRPLQTEAMATANLITTILHSLLLVHALHHRVPGIRHIRVKVPLSQIILATILMGLATAGGWSLCQTYMATPKLASALAIGGVIPIVCSIYFITLYLLRFEDYPVITDIIKWGLKR